MFHKSVSRFCIRNGLCYRSSNAIERARTSQEIIPTVTQENQYEIISDIVTPWWNVDYAEQLVRKKSWSRHVVETLKSFSLQKKFRTVVHDVIPSPVIESYRNKDEFSIRTGIDGNEKTVGFFIGSPAHGKVICVPATKLITLKEDHIHLSQVFQTLIRNSPLTACHDLHNGGFWRNIIVRSNRKGEIMIIVVVHPDGATQEQIAEAKEQILDHFLSTHCDIKSIYFQTCRHVRCTSDQAPYTLLHGDEHLFENYDDLLVRISPDSFCQINTEAALVLYKRAIDFLKVDIRTTILDLCCGIGAFSLLASKHVRGCVGIEYIGQAVDDAIFNAEYNEITNCHFITGRIEKKLKNVMSQLSSDVVPIINPGRAGINKRVVNLLRQTRTIERFVYIACKADSIGAMNNFADFCSRSFDYSTPFSLAAVQGVDMFPQTSQCELILYFER